MRHSHVIAILSVGIPAPELLNATEHSKIMKLQGVVILRSFYTVVFSLGYQHCAGLLCLSFPCFMKPQGAVINKK